MSETLISDAVRSSWDLPSHDEDFPTAKRSLGDLPPGRAVSHHPVSRLPGSCKGDPASPPTVLPGQLWLIEMSASDITRSVPEIAAITTANVVIYDRSLAPVVAQHLPLGGYAEPASTSRVQPDRTLARCLQFARDGWSVAWLTEPGSLHSARLEQVRDLSARLTAGNASATCSVFRLADPNNTEAGLTTAADPGASAGPGPGHHRAGRLGIVVDAGVGDAAPRISVASSNGLAG